MVTLSPEHHAAVNRHRQRLLPQPPELLIIGQERVVLPQLQTVEADGLGSLSPFAHSDTRHGGPAPAELFAEAEAGSRAVRPPVLLQQNGAQVDLAGDIVHGPQSLLSAVATLQTRGQTHRPGDTS
jgi:hypothetical protein